MNDYQYIDENGSSRDYYEIVNENGELCKEIERLNKELKQAREIALNDHKYASEMEDKYIICNNIINELEKEFDSVIKDPLIHMCYKRLARKYADKLQELKGSNSNAS